MCIVLDFIKQVYITRQGSENLKFLISFTQSFSPPYIILSTLFSNILSLSNSIEVSNHISHPYNTNVQIIVLYISILNTNLEDKKFCFE
jgi:hypothetical protein